VFSVVTVGNGELRGGAQIFSESLLRSLSVFYKTEKSLKQDPFLNFKFNCWFLSNSNRES